MALTSRYVFSPKRRGEGKRSDSFGLYRRLRPPTHSTNLDFTGTYLDFTGTPSSRISRNINNLHCLSTDL